MLLLNLCHFVYRVNIGLFCSTPGVALARAVPRKVALEMLLTGNPISAEGKLSPLTSHDVKISF